MGGPHDSDPALEQRLKDLYGDYITFGTDDYLEFDSSQLRVSNLRWLPKDFKVNLRAAFAEIENIFILACKSAAPSTDDPSFCQELANLVGKRVYGSPISAKFYQYIPDRDTWEEYQAHKGDALPTTGSPVVLVSDQGFSGWEKIVGRMDLWNADDIITLYKNKLKVQDPEVDS